MKSILASPRFQSHTGADMGLQDGQSTPGDCCSGHKEER